MESSLPKIVLLNGPPRSGKDTVAAAMLRCDFDRVRVAKFAGQLKDMVHRAFGFSTAPTDFFESSKDQPNPHFHGKTPREVYIAMSEMFVKPFLGKGFFGAVLRKNLEAEQFAPWAGKVVAISDSGFSEEAQELIKWVGPQNVLVVRLHREGTNFDGDSRSYIELPGVRTWDVQNNSIGAPEMIAYTILEDL